MKRMFGIACLSVLILPAQLSALETYVPGYYTEDGTYVAPHEEATPNRSYQKDVGPNRSIDPYRGKTRVPGYYRENGTYVYPQEQPAPNRSYYNNLSRDRIIYHDRLTRPRTWSNSRSPQRRFDRNRNFARRYGAMGGSVPYGPGFRRY